MDKENKEEFVYFNDEWNPGYYDENNTFIKYEKSWYCNNNKIIHNSEKEYLNCKSCNPEQIIIKNNKPDGRRYKK